MGPVGTSLFAPTMPGASAGKAQSWVDLMAWLGQESLKTPSLTCLGPGLGWPKAKSSGESIFT